MPSPPDVGAPVVEIRIDRKSFVDAGSGRERLVLDRVELSLRRAELVALIGPSGCGKSTLLHIVAGLDPDFSGRIHWLATEYGRRPRLGYVFQNPRLLPWLTLRGNIALVLHARARKDGRIEELLAATDLTESADVHANRLSVGMQRRAALARAFVVDPLLLLMDEPFVSLDAPTAEQLRHLLLDVWDMRRPTVIFVTHDLREATLLADRIVFLSRDPARVIGEVQVGIPRDLRRDEVLVGARHGELMRLFKGFYGEDRDGVANPRHAAGSE
ncbi:ABC transporter ATP-binding protein [Thiocapsa rosea]|nr:ABC transporter ATP-binding protein [Thiocapsa rosea]